MKYWAKTSWTSYFFNFVEIYIKKKFLPWFKTPKLFTSLLSIRIELHIRSNC